MSSIGGANKIKDGLVFGYDTGYPMISSNSDSYKFNKGEPTTNLNADPYHSTRSAGDTISLSAWGGDSGQGSFEVNTSPAGGGMMFINHNTSNPAGSGGTYTDFPATRYTLTNGVTYTRSWWAKCDDVRSASGHICSSNRDSDNTYIVGPSISLKTYWQRYSQIFTYTGPTSSDWQFRHINYARSKIYIANVQLEANAKVTPFLNGTRSSTQSLIDLKRTTDIDVSNTSFDSNAQMVFDGTDDKIVIANQTSISSYTYETVVKINSSDSSYSGFGSNFKSDANGYNGVGNGWVIRLDPNGALQVYTKNNSITLINPINISGFRAANINKYIHLVYTYSNGSNKLYIDGVLQATGTGLSGTTPSDSTLIIGAYSWGIPSQTYYINASQPIAKLYNSTLTTSEIKQNFNSLRERFGI